MIRISASCQKGYSVVLPPFQPWKQSDPVLAQVKGRWWRYEVKKEKKKSIMWSVPANCDTENADSLKVVLLLNDNNRQNQQTEKERKRSYRPIVGSECVCLLYWEGFLVKVSVTLYWHSGEREMEGEEERWAERNRKEKEEEECLFSFSSLLCSAFSLPFCPFGDASSSVCVCVCMCTHSLGHLNLLLITSRTSRLSGELLTVEDYKAAGCLFFFF